MSFDIFDVINYLASCASYDMPVSATQLADYLSGKGKIDAAQISETIANYINRTLLPGISIREKSGGYYVEMPLAETDIIILKCALAGLPYCEKLQLSEIEKRLDNFLPPYMRKDNSVEFLADKYPGTFYENVSEIVKALYPNISDNQTDAMTISFEYCVYNENMDLEPKRSHNGELLRTVNPLKIICVQNLFYLVTYYYDKSERRIKYINYRVDKMKNVECTDIPAVRYSDYLSNEDRYYLELKHNISNGMKKAYEEGRIYEGSGVDSAAVDAARQMDNRGFNVSEYRYRSSIMYTDKKIESVKVKTDKTSIGGIIDAFGFDIDIKNCNDDGIIVTLYNVTETTIIKWALQYYKEIEILTPVYLREKIIEATDLISRKYGRS